MEFEGINDVKKLFKKILGSEVIVNDSMDVTEEIIFVVFIQRLEEAFETENKLYEIGGIELGQITEPLWFVLESAFKILYGEDTTNLIWWYIFDRIEEDGEILPFTDEDGKEYIFNNVKELWMYTRIVLTVLQLKLIELSLLQMVVEITRGMIFR
jgi:hypothetical protein